MPSGSCPSRCFPTEPLPLVKMHKEERFLFLHSGTLVPKCGLFISNTLYIIINATKIEEDYSHGKTLQTGKKGL